MQKARKFVRQTLLRLRARKQPARPDTGQPQPLDEAALRQVGGGTATPSTPVKGW